MEKNAIAVALSLVIVIGAFITNDGLKEFFPLVTDQAEQTESAGASIKINTDFITNAFNNLLPSSDRDRAWQVFERYLDYAGERDIAGVLSLSHQASPACSENPQDEECLRLVDSVHFFGRQLDKANFTHVESDDRQIVLYTDYIDGVRIILYFTKTDAGMPKILGMRFCTEGPGGGAPVAECLDDGSARHDSNGDGWWDSVGTLIRGN